MNKTERTELIKKDIYSYPWHLMTNREVREFAMFLYYQAIMGKTDYNKGSIGDLEIRAHGTFDQLSLNYKDIIKEMIKKFETLDRIYGLEKENCTMKIQLQIAAQQISIMQDNAKKMSAEINSWLSFFESWQQKVNSTQGKLT